MAPPGTGASRGADALPGRAALGAARRPAGTGRELPARRAEHGGHRQAAWGLPAYRGLAVARKACMSAPPARSPVSSGSAVRPARSGPLPAPGGGLGGLPPPGTANPKARLRCRPFLLQPRPPARRYLPCTLEALLGIRPGGLRFPRAILLLARACPARRNPPTVKRPLSSTSPRRRARANLPRPRSSGQVALPKGKGVRRLP